MNLGVEEQAQRRKKDKKSKRSSRKKKDTSPQQQLPIQPNHRKIYETKIMKIEQRKIGLIIGQYGKNIKELYKHTHCDVILPKQRRKKDEFDTTADYDYYYVYDSYNNTEQTNMFSNESNESNNKKKKQTESKDDQKEEEEEEDINNPKRLVEIKLRGTPEEIRDAELEINFMMKHGRLMLSNERIRSNENKEKENEIAEDIRVPSKICGMLIGNRGQRVKELMEDTGAEIWVDWDTESHMEAGVSTVHLKGPKLCVENAKFEIKRIQKLFEKGSNNVRFEIPAYYSKDLFGEKGANLKMLQKQYNVSINVKNYRNERRSIRIGDEEERIQRTCLIILIGEERDQIACKKGIDKLVGIFIKCQECKWLKKDDDGYMDDNSGRWYCQNCWDEFNGVKKETDDKEKSGYNKSQNDYNNYNQHNKNKW